MLPSYANAVISIKRSRRLLCLVLALVVAATGCTPPAPGDNSNNNDNNSGPPAGERNEFALWSSGVRLRGANIYQRRLYQGVDDPAQFGPGPLGPPMTQDDFNRLSAMGANYVNISHPGIYTEKPPYVVDEPVQANLDALLAMIASADMFAVISFRSGPGRGEFALFVGEDWYPKSLVNDAMWQDEAAQTAWIAMWRYAAERYRSNSIVVGYDLMVEPNSNHVFFSEFDPQAFYAAHGGSLYDWNTLHPRIVAGIREVDADTPVLVGGMSYSSVNWLAYLQLTGDARTVYTVHNYEPFVYTHQALPAVRQYPGSFDADGDGAADLVNAAWQSQTLAPITQFKTQHNAVVAVNEYGVQRFQPGADAYVTDELVILESLGVNHAIWLWNSSYAGQAELDEFNYLHGADPAQHTNVNDSALLTVIRNNWSKNNVRPTTWNGID